jgi:hypothetical protein
MVLGGACTSEPPPRWVEAHLVRCGECRAEAAALSDLGSYLESHCVGGTPSRTWAELRAELGEARVPERARLSRTLLGAAAACLVVVVVAASVVLWPRAQPVEKSIFAQRPSQRAPAASKARAAIQQPAAERKATAPVVKRVPRRAVPQPVRIRRSVPRPRGWTRPDPRLIADAQPPIPEAKISVMAIAPEEHVIEVVGVSIDQGNEDHYVIREVSAADDEARAVKL